MKLTFFIVAFVGTCRAQLAPDCVAKGGNTYVAVQYAYDPPKTVYFEKGECYPYQIDGNPAQMGVWCLQTICYNKRYADCSGPSDPSLGVPFFSEETLINPLDIVDFVGKAAFCS
ncbi:hypothetical protein V8E51_014273 [Hyaloscypha variabilis]